MKELYRVETIDNPQNPELPRDQGLNGLCRVRMEKKNKKPFWQFWV